VTRPIDDNERQRHRRTTIVLTAEHTAPGGWLAAAIPGRLAVVHQPEPSPEFVARLWAALPADDGIRLVLEELTRNGLTSAPGFVLAEWEGGDGSFDGRFIVRGDSAVTIETASGGDRITAHRMSTWVERPMAGFRGFRVECAPAETSGAPALPLVTGSAWVSALSFVSVSDGVPLPADGVPAGASAPEPAAPLDLDSTIADFEESVADTTLMRGADGGGDARIPAEAVEPEASPIVAPIPPAPLAANPPSTPAAAEPSTALGDHDGLTVMSGDVRAMRDRASDRSASLPSAPPSTAPVGTAVDDGFTLQLPDGSTEPIDGMVVVGRAPSVSKMGGGRVPRLVTVDSAEHDISRNHVQLTVEGGTVVVTDLHSRNGTLIALPGKAPQKLRAGEPTSVIAGTVIDLGSGVTLGVVQA
jgi:hypothetical protein